MSVLLLDETCSDLPVRDTDCKPAVFKAIQDVIAGPYSRKQHGQRTMKVKEKDLKTHRRVSHISREELEDNFIRIHEENILLKDHARKMEDKIKRMGTKLLRVTSDLAQTGKSFGARHDGRDLEAEETIEDLQDRVRDLEHKNESLRHKLVTYKQRLQVQNGCRHCPYSTVAARTDSGVRKNIVLPHNIKRGLRVQSLEARPPQVCQVQACGETLSDEAREEIERLFNLIESQNNRVDDKSTVVLKSMESMRSKDAEMMLYLQKMQQAENQRNSIQENVMLIRLQKELREKNTTLCALKEQFHQLKESYETELQQNQKSLTLSHEAVLTQLEDLTSQLKAERAKVVAMEIEQQSVLNLQRSLQEFQERVTDLEKENALLKENYDSLLKSSLNEDNISSKQAIESELRGKISLLEEQIHHHISDKTLNKEHLQHEREQNEHLKKEVSQLHMQLLEKIQEVKSYQEKVSAILSSSFNNTVPEQLGVTLPRTSTPRPEGSYQMRELEAVMDRWFDDRERRKKTDEKKHQMGCEDEQRQSEDSEKRREEEEQKKAEEAEKQRQICRMDADHAETILELEKTREMLFLQHEINNDYQEELKTLRLKSESESRDKEERKCHYEARIMKYRARIQTLEAQLKDIAYGTFPSRYESESPDVDMSPVPSLQRGETLFEVHIGAVCFTPRGLREVSDSQPHTFCVYSLYDYETHATPVVTGTSPQYSFTSHYAVTPDAEFLRFLRVGTLTVELYQALGGEHRELARGRIKLEATLQSTEKIHGAVTLTDVSGEDIGELDYWICLHGSVSQTQRVHKQSNKARSYLSAGRLCRSQKSLASPFSTGPQNELTIRIWGCRSLKVGYLGYQPSPYTMYRFYHHPDHSTAIIPCSNNPQFGDEFVYQLQITNDLERYLQKECLYVYVFDDEDMQPGVYLGRAEVPLVRLAQGDNIQGDFALLDPCGKCSGSIQISMEWKFSYKTTSYQSTQEIPLSQHCSHIKLQPSVASKVNMTRAKQFKTRKAEEDQLDDITSSKRGRKDFPSTSNQNPSAFQKSDLLPAGYKSNGLDTQQEKGVQALKCAQDNMEEHMEENGISGELTADANDQQSTDNEDDIILVVKPSVPEKPPSSMIRVEIMSLTLNPYSEVMGDSAVQRLFVEFRFAGVPPEETETPVSLRKPNQGEELYYHFSKVIHLDGSEHAERRDFLYMLLEGSDSNGDIVRLKFTVVSDPINEDEEECCDVGYAYMDLRPLLRRAEDKAEETLQVLDVADQEQVIGALRVAIEAKEAARTVHRIKRAKEIR
ncbi:hypothetical protein XENTR_v10002084 [Xenopus tropicalis]|nr:hypothetical protein XENTR_v10002084 [Xenopus tropicalis]